MRLFKNKSRELVEHLNLEIVNLTMSLQKERTINDDLNNILLKTINNTKELKKSLKNALNEVTKANNIIEEQKTEIIMLKKEILAKEQLIEIKENQRRKSAGKVGDLTKKIKKLQDEKEGQNEIIKSFAKENTNLKGLVKSNKDARTYLRGKAERE